MYTVVSQQRPARRGLAAAVMSVVFGVTLGLAALVVRARNVSIQIELGQPVTTPDGRLRFRAPKAWRRIDSIAQAAMGARPAVAFVEPTDGRRVGGRMLLVFQPDKDPLVLDPDLAGLMCRHLLASGRGQVRVAGPIDEPVAVGPLMGWSIDGVLIEPPGGSDDPLRWQARTVVDPMANVTVVVLMRPGSLRRGDLSAFSRICESFSWLEPQLLTDGRQVFEQTGLSFQTTPGVRFVLGSDPRPRSVMLAGGSEVEYPWHVEVYPTWLPPQAKPEKLYQQMLIDWYSSLDQSGKVQRTSLGPNTVWLSEPRDLGQRVTARWLVQTADGQLAWLDCTGHTRGWSRMRQLLEKVAATLSLAPPNVDYATAVKRGEEVMAEITDQGLDRWWADPLTTWMVSPRQGSRFRGATRRIRWVEAEGGKKKYIGEDISGLFYMGQELVERTRTRSWVDQDLQRMTHVTQIDRPLSRTRIEVEEESNEGLKRITRTVQMRGKSEDATVQTPPNFCPDPLSYLAFLLAARSQNPNAVAIFAQTGLAPDQLYWLKVTPLPRRELPTDGGTIRAIGAQIETAISGLAEEVWFAETGQVIQRKSAHGVLVYNRSTADRVGRELPAFRQVLSEH